MNKSILTIIFFLILTVGVSSYAIYYSKHDEHNVTLALIDYFKMEQYDLSKSAFYSYPTTCHQESLNSDQVKNNEILAAFVKANNQEALPFRLKKVEGIARVVEWDDNLAIFERKESLIKSRNREINLIRVSRVGFNVQRNEAVTCIEVQGMGSLYYFKKNDGKWKFNKNESAWVS